MLRLTLDFIPYGELDNEETLGVIEIVNDGTGTEAVGNYRVFFTDKNENRIELERILGHKRPQKLGAWILCRETLKMMVAQMRKK